MYNLCRRSFVNTIGVSLRKYCTEKPMQLNECRTFKENIINNSIYVGRELSLNEAQKIVSKYRYDSGSVDLDVDDNGIAKIRLNNPQSRNAINAKMMGDLDEIINELIQPHWTNVKGAILYGADNNFCSGGDQHLITDMINDAEFGYAMAISMNNVLEKFKNLPMITVAFINGSGALSGGVELTISCDYRMMCNETNQTTAIGFIHAEMGMVPAWGSIGALGGGAELTTSCDYRLMCNETDQTTAIGFIQAKMGMVPAWGSIGRLISIVGRQKALDILLESRPMRAAEAMDAGLVDGTVTTLTDAVRWLSPKIRHDLNVIKATKRTWLCYDGVLDWQTATMMERKIFAPLWSGPAHQLAVQRFTKK